MPKNPMIQDLLSMPIEERAKVHSVNPQMSGMIQSVLDSDSDYQSLPDAEKVSVRINLGFPSGASMNPSPIAAASRAINSASSGVVTQERVRQAQGQQAAEADLAAAPTLMGAIEQITRPFREAVVDPIRSTLARPSALVETPFGNLDVGQQGTTGSLVRGVLRSNPLTTQVVPAPTLSGPNAISEPSFFSIENTAKIATDIMLTAPIFASKLLTGTVPAAASFFQLFIRHPGLSRAVGEAAIQGGAAAAYSVFSEKTTELIRSGELDMNGIATDFGQDFAGATALMLGFRGIGAGVRAFRGKPPTAATPTPSTPQEPYPILDTSLTKAPIFHKTPGNEQAVNSIAQDIGEMIEVALKKGEPLTALSKEAVNVAPTSTTSELLEAAQRAVTMKAAKPGFLQSAEEKLAERKYPPRASEIFGNVAEPTSLNVTSTGIEASIPKSVMQATTVSLEQAIPGDLIYVSRTKGGDALVKIVGKHEKGFTVQDTQTKGTYFVERGKIKGKYESEFQPGDTVYKANGEPVVVKTVMKNGIAHVVDSKGTTYAMQTNKLQTRGQSLENGENIERAAKGIKTPAPEGESVFDLLTDESGSWKPFREISGGATPPDRIVISTYTQPGKDDLGAMSYVLAPFYALGRMGKPVYDNLGKMVHDSHVLQKQIEHGGEGFIHSARKMVGTDFRSSERLTRAALGVLKPNEVLTPAENAVVTQFNKFGQTEVIPLLNARRIAMGEAPLPNDYNYIMHLFPEIILTAGEYSKGLAKQIAPFIKFKGKDNLVDMPWGENSRIEIKANFWELANALYGWVGDEKAWRPTIEALKAQLKNESSASNQKYFRSLINHLDGKQVSPEIAEISRFAQWVDFYIKEKFPKSSVTITGANGKEFAVEVPSFSIGGKTLKEAVMSMRTMDYLSHIGFNLRTILLNQTQSVTDGLARMPGNPLAASFNLLTGFLKGHAALFNRQKREDYWQKGILHNVEDIFSGTPLTAVTGTNWKNIAWGRDWFLNTVLDASFKGMKLQEIVNRVTVYEGRRLTTEQIARAGGVPEAILNSSDFKAGVEELSALTTNTANFLYGKGYKSPFQRSELKLPGTNQAIPLGELLMMYNTYAMNHLGNLELLRRQAKVFGGQKDIAVRMSQRNASPEFANYLQHLEPANRYALLKAVVYEAALASMLSGMLGLGSLYKQLFPTGLVGLNPIPPVIENIGKMIKNVTTLSPIGVWTGMGNLAESTVPGISAGRRFARGGFSKVGLFGRKSVV